MKPLPPFARPVSDPLKESPQMSKPCPRRLVLLLAVVATMVTGLLPTASASAATSPWWQVLTGSRPTNLWIPSDNVQEVKTKIGPFFSLEGVAAKVEVSEEVIGCLGTGTAKAACGLTGFAAEETASELETTLEAALGTDVEVAGGPVGSQPFIITVPDRFAPQVIVTPVEAGGQSAGAASSRVLSTGGSGRLVLTITNLGDAPVDGGSTPVTIVDKLPAGVAATSAVGFAGVQNRSGPVDCTVNAIDLVTCTFGETLPSYESIEIEIFVSLTGEPPTQGSPGKVTVSGGNAPVASEVQEIHVSPVETPFGIEQFSAVAEEEGGARSHQAGAHPFQLTTTVQLNSGPMISRADGVEQPAQPRNLRFSLPSGFVGNATAAPVCELEDFFAINDSLVNTCPDEAAIGVGSVTISGLLGFVRVAVPVFNLPPAAGQPARFGFTVAGDPILIDTRVDPDNQYRVIASVNNTSQLVQVLSSTVTLWGTPGDPRHDSSRGWACAYQLLENLGPCERPANLSESAFLRQPVSCVTSGIFNAEAEPWNVPSAALIDRRTFDGGTLAGCNQVPFNPSIATSLAGTDAGSPSGLDFQVKMPNVGLLNKDAIAEGQAKKVEVTLPEGVSVNPSQANGLEACSVQQYRQETSESLPGRGCPESSKIGSVDITTPLLDEEAHGAVFVATPYENPVGSMLALYLVARIPERGILVKQAGKVELNPETGQLVTTFDNLPQVPFGTFDLHFREGGRAPLVMPPSCGSYAITAKFTPWSAADPDNPQPNEVITKSSSFTVDHGPKGGPCPSGKPPFKPGFSAGTVSNAAGKYSPLNVRLTREDGEQEFSRFSLKLPKGLLGKLAGIPFCSDAAIAAARAKTGPNGGQEEFDNPSCSDASQVGRTLVGAGVGPTLTYAPGKLYLAGPYKGAKLSIVAITTAKVGPFDLGTVVIRQGLKVDPDTAEVSTVGFRGDPIPHILQGIVVHARDIRVYVDRQNFVLNPTSCARMTAAAAVIGSGSNFASTADDQSVDVTAPFQAADCARLGFKPKLSLRLRGGTRRGAHPSLRAVLTARKGDANIGGAQVTLPHSEFLEQAHIRTICTRVQFAAGAGNGAQCPKGSVYGRAKAVSPLLDEPLVGSVYLRSSNHALPDLVAALHSKKVDINLVGRIDSVRGGIRNTFEAVPDAPVTKFVLEMQGGKKGLLVNSTNICQGKHRAKANFTGQNGKRRGFKPLVKARCGGKHKRRSKP